MSDRLAAFLVRVLAVLAVLAVVSCARAARAQEDEEAPAPPPDVGLPGPVIAYVSPPSLVRESRACSARVPLCVHAGRTTSPRVVLDVLAVAERAWETLQGAIGLPAPDVDPAELAYPVFVAPAAESGTWPVERDVRSRLDRARALTVLAEADVAGRGCARDALVAREIARAFLLRSVPATPEAIARAETTYLAELVVPCAEAFAAPAVAAFQQHPERAVCDARGADPAAQDAAFQAGAALFWRRIDWAYGRGPGSMIMASWALAPTRTDVPSFRWHDEPDVFDVLRVSFKGALGTGSTLDDLLLDTAVARAFLGAAEDGLHAPETRALGEAASITPDWDLPWPTSPRRVAPRAPVAPTGMSVLRIAHAGAAPDARLRVEIAWEEHALFRWALVRVDAQGHELGRVAVPTRQRATETQMTLVDLAGVDHVLLVGTNVGDPSYRFDPDDEAWEPHGWLVTLAEERP
ncbi:MAG: hypothetical protein JWP97_301 [Labilithrix sp.]|nr:hypothetical protein [Labilithrix sp.]